jgi:MFS family permease
MSEHTSHDNFLELKKNMKLSKLDGIYSNIMTTMTFGAFLTGFALSLGLNNFQIGIMASLAAFANLFQIVGSYFIEKTGGAKKICIYSVFTHRIIWILIAFLPLFTVLFNIENNTIILMFLIGIALVGITSAISSVSWMSWISELIIETERGKFFGNRNMIMGIAGILSGLIGGYFLDLWEGYFPTLNTWGFSLLILIGVMFGFLSLKMLSLTSEKNKKKDNHYIKESFIKSLKLPFKDQRFRKFLYFGIFWAFAVGIASPFFNVYMIGTLNINFSQIAIFAVISGLTNALGMQFWGNFIDRIGTKTILYITSLGAGITPLLWMFSSPNNYTVLWLVHFFAGVVWSGIGLATSLLLMQLVNKDYKSVYFAIFAAVTGLAASLSPILGGYIVTLISDFEINLGFISIKGLKFIFLITGIIRLSSLGFLSQVEISDQLPIRTLIKKSKSYIAPSRRISQLGMLGMQSLENFNIALTRGFLTSQKFLSKIIKMK